MNALKETYRKQFEGLTNQIDAKQTEIDRLQISVESFTQKLIDVTAEKTRYSVEAAEAQKNYDRLSDKLEKTQREKESLVAEVAVFRARCKEEKKK